MRQRPEALEVPAPESDRRWSVAAMPMLLWPLEGRAKAIHTSPSLKQGREVTLACDYRPSEYPSETLPRGAGWLGEPSRSSSAARRAGFSSSRVCELGPASPSSLPWQRASPRPGKVCARVGLGRARGIRVLKPDASTGPGENERRRARPPYRAARQQQPAEGRTGMSARSLARGRIGRASAALRVGADPQGLFCVIARPLSRLSFSKSPISAVIWSR